MCAVLFGFIEKFRLSSYFGRITLQIQKNKNRTFGIFINKLDFLNKTKKQNVKIFNLLYLFTN